MKKLSGFLVLTVFALCPLFPQESSVARWQMSTNINNNIISLSNINGKKTWNCDTRITRTQTWNKSSLFINVRHVIDLENYGKAFRSEAEIGWLFNNERFRFGTNIQYVQRYDAVVSLNLKLSVTYHIVPNNLKLEGSVVRLAQINKTDLDPYNGWLSDLSLGNKYRIGKSTIHPRIGATAISILDRYKAFGTTVAGYWIFDSERDDKGLYINWQVSKPLINTRKGAKKDWQIMGGIGIKI